MSRILILTILILASPFMTATSYAASPRLTVLTLNACGSVCSKGEIIKRSVEVVKEVSGHNADVMFLNEICYSQYRAIQKSLEARGYHTDYVTTAGHAPCRNYTAKAHRAEYGARFGNAIISKTALTSRYTKVLTNPAKSEARTLLCDTTKLGGTSTRLCTTHLSYDEPNRSKQVAQVVAVINSYAAQKPVIFGGDLNFKPSVASLANRLYAPAAGGKGRFIEAAQTYKGAKPAKRGPITAGFGKGETPHKIDYLFFDSKHFKSPAAITYTDRYSDHKLLKARISFR